MNLPLIFDDMPQERRAIFGQLVRFAISGAFVTALGVAVYSLVALIFRWNPQLGNALSYLVGVTAGYFIHSRWSFRDHGAERTHATRFRFISVSVVSYALNSFWVWLLYSHLGWGRAAPIVPMLFATPLVTFTLNRQWVFR